MIYFFEHAPTANVKIGYSADPSRRLYDLEKSLRVRLRPLGFMPGDMRREKRLHATFAARRVQGEWFLPAPELLSFIGTDATPWPSQLYPPPDSRNARLLGSILYARYLRSLVPDEASGFLHVIQACAEGCSGEFEYVEQAAAGLHVGLFDFDSVERVQVAIASYLADQDWLSEDVKAAAVRAYQTANRIPADPTVTEIVGRPAAQWRRSGRSGEMIRLETGEILESAINYLIDPGRLGDLYQYFGRWDRDDRSGWQFIFRRAVRIEA